jgi:glucose/arabinose dehydrogenase
MAFFRAARRLLVLLLVMLLLIPPAGLLQAQSPAPASRYFAQTQYAVDNDAIWGYFQARGGIDTFGYPISRTFRFRGFDMQLFQRHVLQVVGNQVAPINLLDPDLMPVTRLNQSTFPAHDPQIATAAPPPGAPDYGQAVSQHLNQTVPDQWQGQQVAFRNYYLSAAPPGSASVALVALEVWGFPTSQPMRDPNNNNFIYQRFQRGIMHHDASTGVTRGILLGDAFKSLLTAQNLPPDLAQDLAASPFLGLYDPSAENALARTEARINPPVTPGNTNLAQAFVPVDAAPPPPAPAPPAPGGVVRNPGTAVAPLEQAPPLALELVAQGLTAPVFLASPPDGSDRLFIVDQTGVIRIVAVDGSLLDTPFLDLRNRMVSLGSRFEERGLLGLAFHPDYATNGRFFVYYSAPLGAGALPGWNHTSHLSEFRVSGTDPNRADPASERVVMRVDQPQANHNGGTVAFGPDGYLYISLGDGGGAGDTGLGHARGGNAQDTTSGLGSILRIDVDGDQPYTVPPDNPFVGREGADEIFAYGLRNPYRFSWDRGGTRMMLAADAGKALFEEVNVITAGGNYGWPIREGTHCFDASNPRNPPAQCPDTGYLGEPLMDPVIEYLHLNEPGGLGLVTVGGYVYRGATLPGYHGLYIFGDWSRSFNDPRGRLFASTPQPEDAGLWPVREIPLATPTGELGLYLLGFGEDSQGELYVLGSQSQGPTGETGRVYRLVAAP